MKKILLICGTLVILGGFILLIAIPVVLFKKQSPAVTQPITTPTPVPIPSHIKTVPLTQLEKVSIGTDQATVANLPGLLSKSSLPSGITHYEFQSVYAHAPTVIETQGGKVIFTRTSTYTTIPGGFPSYKQLSSSLGEVEETIKTNITYGDGVVTYVFATKGFCFIVNDNTNAIYEMMRFSPMSVVEFNQKYGEFIAPAPPTRNEGMD